MGRGRRLVHRKQSVRIGRMQRVFGRPIESKLGRLLGSSDENVRQAVIRLREPHLIGVLDLYEFVVGSGILVRVRVILFRELNEGEQVQCEHSEIVDIPTRRFRRLLISGGPSRQLLDTAPDSKPS